MSVHLCVQHVGFLGDLLNLVMLCSIYTSLAVRERPGYDCTLAVMPNELVGRKGKGVPGIQSV